VAGHAEILHEDVAGEDVGGREVLDGATVVEDGVARGAPCPASSAVVPAAPGGRVSGAGPRLVISSVHMRPRVRRSLLGLAVGALVAVLLVALRGTYVAQALELKTLDWRFRTLHDPAQADTNVVIVDVDEVSLDLLRHSVGRFPWPRDVWAMVVQYLSAGGAKVIAFDFGFPDPDLEHPAADSAFAEAARAAGNVVQTLSFQQQFDTAQARRLAAFREDPAALARLTDFAWPVTSLPPALVFQGVEHPYPLLLDASRAVGSINFTPDAVDGTARRIPLFYGFRGRAYPVLGLAAAALADSARLRGGPVRWRRDGRSVTLGAVTVPLDGGGLLLEWRGPYRDPRRRLETYRIYPVAQILHSYEQVRAGQPAEVPLAALRGKVVFVGASGSGLFEARANPFGPADPGVLIHATLADNLLTGDFLRRARPAVDLAAILIAALLAGVAASFVASVWRSAGLGLALATAYLGLTLWLFGARGVWLDAAMPTLGILLTFTGGMAVNYLTEGRHKRQIREMFSKYVAPEYVAQLAEDPSKISLGGRRAELTILFSDIRGFTSISEKMEPHEVIEFLNEYLSEMAAIVKQAGGTLDKFIGDAVMAFWGEPVHHPDHADRAAECALAMQAATARLAARWVAEGKPDLKIGVGINTAEVVVGNIGSVVHKLDYTAIGDGVNLASRLESANKEFHTGIIISEFTLARLGDRFEVRPLGEVRVKGKERPVAIYELLGKKAVTPGAAAVAAEAAR
jgi:adenylate cyclase